jgi:hypothetical protein
MLTTEVPAGRASAVAALAAGGVVAIDLTVGVTDPAALLPGPARSSAANAPKNIAQSSTIVTSGDRRRVRALARGAGEKISAVWRQGNAPVGRLRVASH